MNTCVVVCSNSALDYIKHDFDIRIFRSVVLFGDNEVYDDYTEIKAEDFYNRLINDKSAFPKTAYVSPGKIEEMFLEMKNDGYDSAFVITISEELSGLGKTVRLIAENISDFNVTVYNSKTIAYPEALMALTAARMFKNGSNLDSVIEALDFIRENNHLMFSVETLEYLIKNGRLSKLAGGVANLLSIKPLLDLDKDGKVRTLEKIRTSKKSRERLVEMFLEEIDGKDIIPCIIHANANTEVIEELKNKVLSSRPDLTDIAICPLTPVVGAHAGPKTVCLGYILKSKNIIF